MRRLAALTLVLATVVFNPAAVASPCAPSPTSQRSCCAPGHCGCPGETSPGAQDDGCSCGPAAPAPLAPEPASSTVTGPGRELVAVAANRPAPAVAPGALRPCRRATSSPQAAGPPVFLLDCALLI